MNSLGMPSHAGLYAWAKKCADLTFFNQSGNPLLWDVRVDVPSILAVSLLQLYHQQAISSELRVGKTFHHPVSHEIYRKSGGNFFFFLSQKKTTLVFCY